MFKADVGKFPRMDQKMITAQIMNIDKALLAFTKKTLAKAKEAYELLAVNQKLYIKALGILLVYLLFPTAINPDLEKGILGLFFLVWISAISCDLITMYKKIYETLIGKAMLLLLLTIFTNVAIGLSAQVVNDITGINPSNFPHTQAMLAVLMIPLLIVGMGAFLYFAILILSPLILMFHISGEDYKRFFIPGYSMTNKLNFLKITRIVQVVSLIVFLGIIYSASQKISNNYSIFVSDSARFLVYNMEMYSRAPCAIEGGGKVAFVGDDKVLVGFKNKSKTVFKLAECKTVF
ncbi:MAG: hypothetical protein ACO1N8_05030 [Methylophilus sp.]